MIEKPNLKSSFKVKDVCLTKEKNLLKLEFDNFVDSIKNNGEELPEGIEDSSIDSVEDFFILLNQEKTLYYVVNQILDPNLCYYLWLFGLYK